MILLNEDSLYTSYFYDNKIRIFIFNNVNFNIFITNFSLILTLKFGNIFKLIFSYRYVFRLCNIILKKIFLNQIGTINYSGKVFQLLQLFHIVYKYIIYGTINLNTNRYYYEYFLKFPTYLYLLLSLLFI